MTGVETRAATAEPSAGGNHLTVTLKHMSGGFGHCRLQGAAGGAARALPLKRGLPRTDDYGGSKSPAGSHFT